MPQSKYPQFTTLIGGDLLAPGHAEDASELAVPCWDSDIKNFEGEPFYATLPEVVTPGTYYSVSVNANGIVIGGSTSFSGLTGDTGPTDNALLRADGTSGSVVQASPVIIEDTGELYNYRVQLNKQTGTTYTLATSDTGKVVECNNSTGITITLPNSLPVGFGCTVMQTGAGQVTFSAASGASFTAYNSKTKCAGQYAAVTIWVHSNSGGSAAQYRIAGTMA